MNEQALVFVNLTSETCLFSFKITFCFGVALISGGGWHLSRLNGCVLTVHYFIVDFEHKTQVYLAIIL